MHSVEHRARALYQSGAAHSSWAGVRGSLCSLSSRPLPVQLSFKPEGWLGARLRTELCTYRLHFCLIVCHLWGLHISSLLGKYFLCRVSLLEKLCSGLWVCFMLTTSSTFQRDPVKGSSVYGTTGWSPALKGTKPYCWDREET